MQRALMLAASVVVMTWAASALADSPNLKGPYGFTGSAACMAGLHGTTFDPVTFRALGPAFGHSFAVEGIRTFNGDGTGTAKGSGMGISFPTPPSSVPFSFPPAAGSEEFQFSFTYTANPDGSW